MSVGWEEWVRIENLIGFTLMFSCNGGDHEIAFEYFIKQGIVTGGAFHSKVGCKPYLIKPDNTSPRPKDTKCELKCEPSYKKHSYADDKIRGKGIVLRSHDNKGVMDEITANGPVVAEFTLYADFLSYTSGIYQHKAGSSLGQYYAKIVGWGKDSKGIPYWRAAASFGKNWGLQ